MIRIAATLALVSWLGSMSLAADPADAHATIDRAIQAVGGEAKLAQFKAQTWKEKGTYYGMGEGLPYTGNYAVQWPDQFKMEIVDVFTLVVNKDQGWTRMGEETKAMSQEQLAEQKESLYAGWLASLLPLKDKMFQLTSLPESKIDGKPALGVQVVSKGRRDVNLWFDQDSRLLIKFEYQLKAEDLGGKLVKMENAYSDWKEVDGIKVPMKLVMKRDGKLFLEAVHHDLKRVAKLPDELFAKP